MHQQQGDECLAWRDPAAREKRDLRSNIGGYLPERKNTKAQSAPQAKRGKDAKQQGQGGFTCAPAPGGDIVQRIKQPRHHGDSADRADPAGLGTKDQDDPDKADANRQHPPQPDAGTKEQGRDHQHENRRGKQPGADLCDRQKPGRPQIQDHGT